jgi:hypothetical protein
LYSCDARVEFDPNTKTLDARWTYRVSDPADSRIFEEWSAELKDLPPDSNTLDDYYSLLERGTYNATGDLCPYLTRLEYKKQTVLDGEIEMEELESFDCSSGTITTSLPELYFPSSE